MTATREQRNAMLIEERINAALRELQYVEAAQALGVGAPTAVSVTGASPLAMTGPASAAAAPARCAETAPGTSR